MPDVAHWKTVLPKLTNVWRNCTLLEVLAKWYTRKHIQNDGKTEGKPDGKSDGRTDNKSPNNDGTCYCRKSANETSVLCCNPECAIKSFHLLRLRINSIPKTWYCSYCRTQPQFKRSNKNAQQLPKVVSSSEAMDLDIICTCKSKPCASDTLLKWLNKSCNNGKFFHLTCLKYKRMPNNSQTIWICPGCRKSSNITKSSKNKDDITFVKILHVNNNHWVCISSINCQPGYVNLLDSLASSVVSQEVEDLVRSILGPSNQGVNIQHVQQQQNVCDCGVLAIAFATCLAYAKLPQCLSFNIPMMRPHLLNCLKNRSMELFPAV
ncbi:Chromatin modification-related YNG2 [Paramuricea clavata]|uniref:Chromatin modification-related YNG2 n=1 Tax=Paramuricea clavata TaxID=317549 RepID=A0A6S7LH08_PARCT|nr:Chromatin modification-related YNG2 [Paramuricea clavata]